MAKNIDIPNGWEKTEFDNIVILRNKKYTPKDSENLKCIELECIEKENGNLLYYLNSNTQKSTKTYFYKNDILYGKLRPYLKKFIYAKDDGVCSSEIWVFSATKKINNYFLFLIIQTNKFNYITNISTGTRMPRADWDIVSNYPILLPPLAEQEKIAEILSLWDKAIEQTKELIAYKEKQKKGLMQNLLTGKKRLHGFNDKWKTVKLGDCFTFIKGQGLSKEKINSSGKYFCILYGELYTTYTEVIQQVVSKTNHAEGILSKSGDILIPCSTTTKAIDLATASSIKIDDVYIGADINILRPKININSDFIAFSISNIIKNTIAKYAQGSTIIHLYGKDIKPIKIKLPTIYEQNNIVDILCKADEEIELLNKQLDLYTEQKKGLMQNLLTGKVRVTV